MGVQTNAASKSSDFSNSSTVSYAGTEYLEENSLHLSAFPSHIALAHPFQRAHGHGLDNDKENTYLIILCLILVTACHCT